METAVPELRRFLLDGQGGPSADRLVGYRYPGLLTLQAAAAR
ncbi:hypothetical protein ACFXP3_06820 [Streptomyces sp. NPDC059096]